MSAKGLHSGDVEGVLPKNDFEPTYARPIIANPGPVGLLSFASTTFILSLYNVNTRGIHTPNVVVGMALFCGGLTQFVAGMWEFPRGNVFGATAFSSYGAFWMSYATIFIPSSGVLTAYTDPKEFASAVGVYLITWFMVTVMFLLTVVRKNLAFTALLSMLSLAFLLLAIGAFTGMSVCDKAGGVFGLITAAVAYYISVSEMLAAEQTAILKLPLGVLTA